MSKYPKVTTEVRMGVFQNTEMLKIYCKYKQEYHTQGTQG